MVKYVSTTEKPVMAAQGSNDIANYIVPVQSSNIFGYYMDIKRAGDNKGTLYVQFLKNGMPGDIYAYYDVPLQIARKMASTSSKGHYFWKYIRDKYQTAKLTGDKKLAKDRKK